MGIAASRSEDAEVFGCGQQQSLVTAKGKKGSPSEAHHRVNGAGPSWDIGKVGSGATQVSWL